MPPPAVHDHRHRHGHLGPSRSVSLPVAGDVRQFRRHRHDQVPHRRQPSPQGVDHAPQDRRRGLAVRAPRDPRRRDAVGAVPQRQGGHDQHRRFSDGGPGRLDAEAGPQGLQRHGVGRQGWRAAARAGTDRDAAGQPGPGRTRRRLAHAGGHQHGAVLDVVGRTTLATAAAPSGPMASAQAGTLGCCFASGAGGRRRLHQPASGAPAIDGVHVRRPASTA